MNPTHPGARPPTGGQEPAVASGGRLLDAALAAAARGWPVFPLIPGGKTPAIRAVHPAGHPCRGECGRWGHGFHDATCEPDVIRAWWACRPRANYGISTGPVHLAVIDLDTPKGHRPDRVLPDVDREPPGRVQDGAGVLAWAAHLDDADPGWADTFTVATPSGGRHLYYAVPEDTLVRSSVGATAGRITGVGWCVDVRAVGGYVVGPACSTPTGAYRVTNPTPPRALPAWLAARLHPATGEPTPPCARKSGAVEVGASPAGGARVGRPAGFAQAAIRGELAHIAAATPGGAGGTGRNATVNRAAYKLGRLVVACALDPGALAEELVAAARATGLGEREARTAVASGLAAGQAHPRTLETTR